MCAYTHARARTHIHAHAQAATDMVWSSYVQTGIDKYNNEVAVSRAQKIATFVILDRDISIPGGEITPTQKLKRAVVMTKYHSVIENDLYGQASMRKNKSAMLR